MLLWLSLAASPSTVYLREQRYHETLPISMLRLRSYRGTTCSVTTTNLPAAPGAGSVESMYMRRVLQKDIGKWQVRRGGGGEIDDE
jgi:hypothetical protein